MAYYGILLYIMVYHGILLHIMVYMVYYCTLWYIMACRRIMGK